MEEDILENSPAVMFRGTPCIWFYYGDFLELFRYCRHTINKAFHLYINLACLGVCLFLSIKRQNG